MFWTCLFLLILGLYFAYHCFELLSEQFESIAENQSFIDDLKGQYGTPVSLWQGLKMALGEDTLFWLLPTTPVLSINYHEQVWSQQ